LQISKKQQLDFGRAVSIFKGFRHCVQQPNGKPFGCQKICDRLKFLWALPTPTTFEKVDQTFIII